MPDRVLLTGVSGFIAKHVALELLRSGYHVRGTLRSLARSGGVREALATAGGDVSRLGFAEADLLRDDGWREAARDCRFLVHTASPFPSRQGRDRFALVPAAKDGTLRAVEAAKAAGVERIVVTSSVVSVYLGHGSDRDRPFAEEDWTRVENREVHAYGVSKTEAEKAAWDAVADGGPPMAAINPAFVLGPVLGREAGTSASLFVAMMKGRMPMVPNVAFGVVDVRDVALAHVRAMERPQAAGRRFILSAGTLSMMEIGRAVAAASPGFAGRMPRFLMPDGLVRAAGFVSAQARTIVPELGRRKRFDTAPARDLLGVRFRPPDEAVAAMADSLVEKGLV